MNRFRIGTDESIMASRSVDQSRLYKALISGRTSVRPSDRSNKQPNNVTANSGGGNFPALSGGRNLTRQSNYKIV